MMKTSFLMACIFLLVACVSGQPITVGQMASNLRAIPRAELDRSDLPVGFEEIILEELRRVGASHELYRLNDQLSIDRLVDHVRRTGLDSTTGENTGRDGSYIRVTLPRCQSPYILDDLAELLYEGRLDPANPKGLSKNEQINFLFYQNFVAELVLGVAARVPEFSEEVRASVKAPGSAEDLIAWYEANKSALIEERFADVRPFFSSKAIIAPTPAPVPLAEAQEAPLPPTVPLTPTPVVEPATPSASPSLWLLLAPALVLLLWLFTRLHRKR